MINLNFIMFHKNFPQSVDRCVEIGRQVPLYYYRSEHIFLYIYLYIKYLFNFNNLFINTINDNLKFSQFKLNL